MEFTNEQLIEKLQHRIAVAANYPDLEEAQLDAAIFSIALASLTAEPVFFITVEGDDWIQAGRIPGSEFDFNNLPDGVVNLYAAPPAPVTIDERAAFNAWNNEDNLPGAGVGAKNAAWLAWQARAKLGSPPAPVVPDKMTYQDGVLFVLNNDMSSIERGTVAMRAWNACRAAMLASAPALNKGEH